jgi:hypothetical protein
MYCARAVAYIGVLVKGKLSVEEVGGKDQRETGDQIERWLTIYNNTQGSAQGSTNSKQQTATTDSHNEQQSTSMMETR